MRRLFLFFSIALLSLACQGQISKVTLKTVSGKNARINLREKATVILFLSPECPLCQSYTLTIKNLEKEFSGRNVHFVGIIPGKEFSKESILAYIKEYNVTIPILLDEQKELTNLLQATVTPEVCVLNSNGQVQYRGRIDNWAYEPGKKRKIITEHNLQDALNSISTNQPVKVPKTKAIGCFIE